MKRNSLHATYTISLVYSSIIASLSCLNTGFNIGISNLLIDFIGNCDKNQGCIIGDSWQWNLILGCLAIGGLTGAILASTIVSSWGYRAVFYTQCLVFLIGGIITVISLEYWHLIIARLILGVGCGISTVSTPNYLSQVASVNTRGFLSGLTGIQLSLGLFLSNSLSLLVPNQLDWRVLMGFIILVAVIQAILLYSLIESPRNQLLGMEEENAKNSLQKLRKGYDIEQEYTEIQENIINETDQQINIIEKVKKLFKDKPALKSSIVAISLICFQELSGITAILYYSSFILSQNLPPSQISFGIMIISLLALVASLLCAIMVDPFGRRKMLLLGVSFQCLCWIGVVIGAWLQIGILQLVSLIIFVFTFTLAMLPISYIMLPELVPTLYLDFISAISLFLSWLLNFIVGTFFPMLLEAASWYSLIIFIITNVALWFLCLFCVPETSRLSLEEITFD